jgi:hypothetical protein
MSRTGRQEINMFRALLVLSFVLLCGGAAFGQTVTSTYDKDYGLSRLLTYEFKVEKRDGADPLSTDTLTEKMLKDALDDELETSGYRAPSDGTAPNFLVSFHVKTKDMTEERGVDRNYVQGILIVDFYDAATNKLVWRGVASGVVGQDAVDLKLAEEKAKTAAKLLMEQFGKDILGF